MDTVYNFFGNEVASYDWWLHPFVFVAVLVLIVGGFICFIIGMVQKTKRMRDEQVVKKNEINLEAEIIKNLRELVRLDSNKTNGKDEPNKKYVYQKGNEQYSLKSEDNILPHEKFMRRYKFKITILNSEQNIEKIKEKLIESLKQEKGNFDSNKDTYIRDFLKWKARKHLIDDPKIEVYLDDDLKIDDYSDKNVDKENSYIIEFTLVTIVLLSQYESLRIGIEYFMKDIKTIFNKIIGSGNAEIKIID